MNGEPPVQEDQPNPADSAEEHRLAILQALADYRELRGAQAASILACHVLTQEVKMSGQQRTQFTIKYLPNYISHVAVQIEPVEEDQPAIITDTRL